MGACNVNASHVQTFREWQLTKMNYIFEILGGKPITCSFQSPIGCTPVSFLSLYVKRISTPYFIIVCKITHFNSDNIIHYPIFNDKVFDYSNHGKLFLNYTLSILKNQDSSLQKNPHDAFFYLFCLESSK